MRYQRIFTQIWHDEKFITLSEDAQKLFLYCMTSPHSNMIGLYVLPELYILADLKWSQERFAKPFKELLAKPLIKYDKNVNLILILNHFKHNLLENPNQVKKAIKVVEMLPVSPLFSQLKQKVTQLGKQFTEPLVKQLEERYSKSVTVTEEVTVTEIKETTLAENGKKKLEKGIEKKIIFDYVERKFVNITDAHRTQWQTSFPAVDVLSELRRVEAWVVANPKNRKSNWERFIVNWLSRAQDKAKPLGYQPTKKREGVKNETSSGVGLNKKDYRKGTF